MYVYEVRTSKAIAEEMCRYDNAQIVSSEIFREAPDQILELNNAQAIEQFRKYQFTIRCQRKPTRERWTSFGVKVRNLRKE